MSNYCVDIAEIVSFIESVDYQVASSTSIQDCVVAFTEKTGESYLDERAEMIVRQLDCNPALKKALCSGEYCDKCEDCVVRKYCNTYIHNARENAKGKLKLIDLFCGAGG